MTDLRKMGLCVVLVENANTGYIGEVIGPFQNGTDAKQFADERMAVDCYLLIRPIVAPEHSQATTKLA